MHRTVALSALLLLLLASAAVAAPGFNLTWGAKCWKDGGTANLDFACNTTTGTVGTLTVSFAPAAAHDDFISASIVLEGMSETASVPDWWRLGTGECRNGSFALVTDFTAVPTSCTDLWEGGGFGSLGQYLEGGNRIHVYALWVPDYPIPIGAAVEYACAMFTVDGAKTTGAGACSGCSTPLAWGLDRVELGYLNGAPTEILTEPLQNQCVTWQHSTLGCGTVPVRSMTWGQVKSLYR